MNHRKFSMPTARTANARYGSAPRHHELGLTPPTEGASDDRNIDGIVARIPEDENWPDPPRSSSHHNVRIMPREQSLSRVEAYDGVVQREYLEGSPGSKSRTRYLSGLRSRFHACATTLRPIYFVNSRSSVQIRVSAPLPRFVLR
jgi:hypothetical protein